MTWETLLIPLAKEAGNAIMKIYGQDFSVEEKEDKSPLTQADLAANDLIIKTLAEKTPNIPVLSEETIVDYDTRKDWTQFWLVDPLDGTKEFIKRNGEFTVNIALIENGKPIAGVVHAPALNTTYFAENGTAYLYKDGTKQELHTQPNHHPLLVVASRSHQNDETKAYLANLPEHELTPKGSSLKICIIAEGKADLYPRLGPTMEWDIGAAQAILEAAGGSLTTTDGKPITYNKQNLLNPHFIAKNKPA